MRELIGRMVRWLQGGRTFDWGAGPVFVPEGWAWSMSVTTQTDAEDAHVTGRRYTVTLTKDVQEPTPVPLLNPAYAHLWQPAAGDAKPAGSESGARLPIHSSEELSP
ncbi:hypothetical protein J0H58_28300 [bacterium]|nr:hypothetical protein [bacterium]